MANLLLTGKNLVGADAAASSSRFTVVSRLNFEDLEPEFSVASVEEIAAAAVAALAAFPAYAALPSGPRADFLEAIAREIEGLGDPLLERASAESGLPLGRLTGERGRTCNQLRMFAALVREGSWVDARIDHGDPSRKPVKPDVRRMLIPLGPVAVFGASNFPLAFSVAGGDTASALAAGCPVVVKAHPAHPGTSEAVGRAILAAADATGMPGGVFSLLHGGAEVGEALVLRPEIYAVGFTGSLRAGRALFDYAAGRPRPIPVYAEMGSVNPVFLLPGALEERLEAISAGYAESLTLGVGQFCTNPGIVVGMAGEAFDRFLSRAADALGGISPGTMLTDDIHARFVAAVARRATALRVVHAPHSDGQAGPALFSTSAAEFLDQPTLAEEVFGPAGLAVACASEEEMAAVATALEGQLTATLHFASPDAAWARRLLPLLERMAGRIVFNGFPTGVEVGPAMQHGGPYPATTDPRSTSVGTAAILRFARPVAWQDAPTALLPPELHEDNPRGITRLVDGKLSLPIS